MHMISSGLTDKGLVRPGNEDFFLIKNSLLIVADGMGGAAAGEVASSLTAHTIADALEGVAFTSAEEAEILLGNAIRKADARIQAAVEENRSLNGMGTTVVAAVHLRDALIVGYVGDSRAYIVSGSAGAQSAKNSRPSIDADAQTVILQRFDPGATKIPTGGIRRLTDDHSVVMEMVNSGIITENDIRTHPFRNRITRCVGSLRGRNPDFRRYAPRNGDILVLCSDGLWEMMHEDLIQAVATSSDDPKDLCRRLIDAANDAGGSDNITAVTAIFRER